MENRDDLIHSDLSFLEKLSEYTFDSKMLCCQKYASRIMTMSEVSTERMLEENIMPWELESFTAFSIIYDAPDAGKIMDEKVFGEIITLLRNYWHPELTMAEQNDTYAEYFMMISILQQLPTQGMFLQKLFRCNFFFNFKKDTLDMVTIFKDKFEDEYRNFELFAFIVFVACSLEGQRLLKGESWSNILNKAFSIGNVLKQLSIRKDKYKELLDSQYNGNLLDYYYGLKVQYLYPIIEDANCFYIPSPYLVVNAVTESLLNRLTLANMDLRRTFGKDVLEEYLYYIYREVNSVTWIKKEFTYNVGKDVYLTPDVLVEEMGNAILFDTKALSPNLKMRKFDKNEIEKETNIYAENILQLYRRILDLNNGYYSLKNTFDIENIFGVVVVLEDAAVPRDNVYKKTFELLAENGLDDSPEIRDYIHSHIKVVPLRQIEQTVLMGGSYMECLLNQVNNRDKWNNYNYFISKKEFTCIPSYELYCNELKATVKILLNT